MTREEYENYIEALKARGYKFGGSWYTKPYYYKVIECRDNEYGDSMVACQLIFNIYKMEFSSGNDYYSIVPVVVVSRNIDERLNFTIGLTKRSVEECERIAKEFMKWVDINIDIEN